MRLSFPALLLSSLWYTSIVEGGVFRRTTQCVADDTTRVAVELQADTITVAELFVEHETWVPCTETKTTNGKIHVTTYSMLSTTTYITSSTLSSPSACSDGGCLTTKVSTIMANSSTAVVISGTETIPLLSLTKPTTMTISGHSLTLSPVYWSTPSPSPVYWSTPSSGIETSTSSASRASSLSSSKAAPSSSSKATPSSSSKTALSSSSKTALSSSSKTALSSSSKKALSSSSKKALSSSSTAPSSSSSTAAPSSSSNVASSSIRSRTNSLSSSKPISSLSTSASSAGTDRSSSITASSQPTTVAPSTGRSSASGISSSPASSVSSKSHTNSSAPSTNSLGQTIISGSVSGIFVTLPTGLSSATTIGTGGETLTYVPSITGVVTSTDAAGQTILSKSGVIVTLPTSLSGTTTITTDGETLTFVPPGAGVETSVNSAGQTVISESGIVVTLPTGLSSATTITTAGETLTFVPPSVSAKISVNSAGQTVISESGVVVTLPIGLSTATTITSGGETLTFSPSSSASNVGASTTVNSAGQTILSESSVVVTLPTGLTKATTVTTDGETLTFLPSGVSANSTHSNTTLFTLTTTNPAGETVISNSDGIITVPTGITTPITTTEPDGVKVTITPAPTSPSGTPPPSSTSSSGAVLLVPVTTSINAPEPTSGGTKIPCSLWFFDFCLDWKGTDIFGWLINLPPGDRPPGPPPAISIPPELHLTISVKGTLPPWPAITIGPDNLPTYSPEPTDCQTQTAEFCATQTVYGVATSGTVATTTGSQVLSTCATITGCVEGSSTATTSTATCAASSTACPSGNKTPRVVLPASMTDTDQIDTIAAQLQNYVSDPSDIYNVTAGDAGFVFWGLPLTNDQVNNVSKIANVAAVYDDCADKCNNDPTIEGVYYNLDPIENSAQSWPRKQLGYISWPPPSVNPNPDRDQYWFDDSAGEGVDVYILDTGASLSHPEFATVSGRARWLPDGVTQSDGYNYHGTGMLSTVTGATLGVSKNVNPILVRVGADHPTTAYSPWEWLKGLGQIDADLGTKGSDTTTTCIILLATQFLREAFAKNQAEYSAGAFTDQLFGIMKSLVAKGAIPITGSGNENSVFIDAWPQNFGKPGSEQYLEELLVMGSISADGIFKDGSHSRVDGLPQAYAPGIQITSAQGETAKWSNPDFGLYKTGHGTSQAAAHTAGLAAYFLSLIRQGQLIDNGAAVENNPLSIKNFIIGKAWSRQDVDGAPRPGIWNAVTQLQCANEWISGAPSRLLRRQASSSAAACTSPLVTNSSVASSSSAASSTVSSTSSPTTSSTSSSAVSSTPSSPPSSTAVISSSTPSSTAVATSTLTSAPTTSLVATTIAANTSSAIGVIVSILSGLEGSTSSTSSTASPSSNPINTSDLPTLPATTAIVTPSGSSCITTSAITSCGLGPNPSETACVTSSSCASFVSVTQLATATASCYSAGTFGDVAPTDENQLDVYIGQFCSSSAVTVLADSTYSYEFDQEFHVDGYADEVDIFSVKWLSGCYLDGQTTQNVSYPIGPNGPDCNTILADTYLQCNNGGVGGYINAGCLSYSFNPQASLGSD